MRLLVLAAALLTVTGCGFNSGLLQNVSPGNQLHFSMDVSRERYSRSVSGSSSIGSILCVIPLDEGGFRQATEALHEDAHLKPNEALQDIRVDYDPLFLVLYCVKRLTISADVYEMTPTGGLAPAETRTAAAAAPPAKSARLTYGQLQEANAQIQADREKTNVHEIAVRILGQPQKTDAENEFWYGGVPGKDDCYVLRLSSRGASLDDAPSEKCQ